MACPNQRLCVLLYKLITCYSFDSAWFQRLKLKCDEILSNLAYNFSLRRYTEAFSGTQAATLRGHLERAGDRYFESLHAQRLEALRQMLDREVWVRLPEAAAQQARTELRAAAARGEGRTAAAGGVSAEAGPTLAGGGGGGGDAADGNGQGSGRFDVAAFGGVAEDGSAFASWVRKGNPFTEGASNGGSAGEGGGSGEVARKGDGASGGNDGADPSPRDEEDEEDAEVRAAYIDEVGRRRLIKPVLKALMVSALEGTIW
jgi:hypothetical protein